MIVYIDDKYNCYTSDDGTRRGFETTFFDGKGSAWIEGFIYVPKNETYIDEYGCAYHGEMCIINADYNALEKAQLEFELAQLKIALADAEDGLRTLGAEWEESNG